MTRLFLQGIATALAAAMTLGTAFAGEVEATIVEIDPNSAEMQLSDGNRYEIPVDFFIDDLKPGLKVLAFFDEDGDQKTLTDVQVME
ncbi:DUF1344 domain-containing protein [Stappia sp. ES.058]|uniref:DUF1344 domain-containing protein n=1 Tax=Stappia sp. ES.058 TaxID=1881061 RepID=UPI0012FE0117|nr:DUF1344 domain-containing protein [Stappia sp. ES.058]